MADKPRSRYMEMRGDPESQQTTALERIANALERIADAVAGPVQDPETAKMLRMAQEVRAGYLEGRAEGEAGRSPQEIRDDLKRKQEEALGRLGGQSESD